MSNRATRSSPRLLAFALTAFSTTLALGGVEYSLTRIATPSAIASTVGDPNYLALNNLGQVAGSYYFEGTTRGFATGANGTGIWTIEAPAGGRTLVYDINNNGVVVGDFVLDGSLTTAFRANANGSGFIAIEALGAAGSTGRVLNDAGRVAGLTGLPDSGINQVLFVTDSLASAPVPVTVSASTLRNMWPNAINNSAQLAWTDRYSVTAYLLNPTIAGAYAATQILPTNAIATLVWDMNDSAQVVGSYRLSGSGQRAFVSEANGAEVIDITGFSDASDVVAFGINNSGAVVGYTADLNGLEVASRYEGATWTDLNSVTDRPDGVRFRYAFDINDSGQILVADDQYYLWLLSPVPEPSSTILLVIGALFIAYRIRRPLTLSSRADA